MRAILVAGFRSFLRDRPGMVLTLVLPPLVYLLFAAIFGAGARGEIDLAVVLHDGARTVQSRVIEEGLAEQLGGRLRLTVDPSAAEQMVTDGRADAGVLLESAGGDAPRIIIIRAPGRETAGAALSGQVQHLAEIAAGETAPTRGRMSARTVGPPGDAQAVYYVGAVSVMFVFFAAMHGAMAGLDDRRSGLQARLALAAGGLRPVIGGRAALLTVTGVIQTVFVFAVAYPSLPALSPLQVAGWLVTAVLAAASAAGLALAIISLCRSRGQAQPLSTFIVLLLAAIGGSMAPRFLMPEVFRQIGWATPHAWAIEAYQTLLWRGVVDQVVVGAWVFLAGVAFAGWLAALAVEARRPLP